ncbi:hypothetical protein DL96DRAFT_1607571 [Flagelloscypha sp. PMI_526]|nr:hypothetical protein DL96DRAFT_1607571 [Flagelloscypha sp. PMI_526]
MYDPRLSHITAITQSISSSKPSMDLPLDFFIEIFDWLPKQDLLVWALTSSKFLIHVQRAMFRSLQVSDSSICKLMEDSSQNLMFTTHLRIKYYGYSRNSEVVNSFLRILVGHGQLRSFELVTPAAYSETNEHSLVFPILAEELLALTSLKRIGLIMNAHRGRATTSLLRQVMTHPALCFFSASSCDDVNDILRDTPRSSPLISFGIHLNRLGVTRDDRDAEWKELVTHLDLSQLRRLSLRWVLPPSDDQQEKVEENIQNTLYLPNLTDLYFEVGNVPFKPLLFHFANIHSLTVSFLGRDIFPYNHLATALLELNPDALRSICVYVPMPWAFLIKRPWATLFKALKGFTSLRQAEIFFARVAGLSNPILPHRLMDPEERWTLINSMKSESLLPDNIRIIQEAEISDVRLINE